MNDGCCIFRFLEGTKEYFLSSDTWCLSRRFSVSIYCRCIEDEICQNKLARLTKLFQLMISACRFQVSNLKTVGPSPSAFWLLGLGARTFKQHVRATQRRSDLNRLLRKFSGASLQPVSKTGTELRQPRTFDYIDNLLRCRAFLRIWLARNLTGLCKSTVNHCIYKNSLLTLILLTWKIRWAPNNASRWQMGFNSMFKGLNREQRMFKPPKSI